MPEQKQDEKLKIRPCAGEHEPIQLRIVIEPEELSHNSAELGPESSDSNSSDPAKSSQSTEQSNSIEIRDELAKSSTGSIYLAGSEKICGKLALRVFNEKLIADEVSARRLLSSLERASETCHPNLSSYYDFGRRQDRSCYLLRDFHEAQSLKELIAGGKKIEAERLLCLVKQICQGLKALHARQVVHGDLKPANIFILKEGRQELVKLVDYGVLGSFDEKTRHIYLALRAGESDSNYMSPEQCLSFELDARSDIYALGLIMYECLSGEPLVSGYSQMHALMMQLNQSPQSLKDKNIGADLERIIQKCLAKNRSDRYFSIDDLELELDLLASGLSNFEQNNPSAMSIQGQSESENELHKRNRRRRRTRRIAFGLAGAFLISGITAGAILRHDSSYYAGKAEEAISKACTLANSELLLGGGDYFVDTPAASPSYSEAFDAEGNPIPDARKQILSQTPEPVSSDTFDSVRHFRDAPGNAPQLQPVPGDAPQAQPLPGQGAMLSGSTIIQPGVPELQGLADGSGPGTQIINYNINPQEMRRLEREKSGQYDKALKYAERAIIAYRIQNPFRSDRKFKMRLADLQQLLGEVYLKDRFSEPGGRLDPAVWYNMSNYAAPINELDLQLSFPGLLASQSNSDYKSAEVWFEKARRTLGGRYLNQDIDLLWNLAYTKYHLGQTDAAINLHKQLKTAISAQPVPDKQALVNLSRNIGLLYLRNSNWSQAVHYLKEAKELDGSLNKIPGPLSGQIKVELAYAFLREGLAGVAEKLANENDSYFLKRDLAGDMSDPSLIELNQRILTEARLAQNKS